MFISNKLAQEVALRYAAICVNFQKLQNTGDKTIQLQLVSGIHRDSDYLYGFNRGVYSRDNFSRKYHKLYRRIEFILDSLCEN
jgi:hypothetical protein